MEFFRSIYRVLLVVSALVLLCHRPCLAQRTYSGQYYFDVSGSASVVRDPSLGGAVRFGQYLLSSRWEVGVQGMLKKDGVRYYPVLAEGTYLYRFCSDRSRAVHLYGGIGAHIGLEVSMPEAVKPGTGYGDAGGMGVDLDFSEVDRGGDSSPATVFLYGVQPRLEAEVFLFRRVALVGAVAMPLTFGSAHRVFNMTGTVGLRYNL